MIALSRDKNFSVNDIAELFHSVNWDMDTPPDILTTAMMNSTNVVTAWDEDRLVGIIRSMDDSVWNANIDCLIVHKDYQNRGIGSLLLTEMLKLLGKIMYISVSPNEEKNIGFYEKFGFKVIKGSTLLQLCN